MSITKSLDDSHKIRLPAMDVIGQAIDARTQARMTVATHSLHKIRFNDAMITVNGLTILRVDKPENADLIPFVYDSLVCRFRIGDRSFDVRDWIFISCLSDFRNESL